MALQAGVRGNPNTLQSFLDLLFFILRHRQILDIALLLRGQVLREHSKLDGLLCLLHDLLLVRLGAVVLEHCVVAYFRLLLFFVYLFHVLLFFFNQLYF